MSGDTAAGVTPADIISFWQAAGPKKWFEKDGTFDAEVRTRFLHTYEAIVEGQHSDWPNTADGALATIIVLDQFSRNMFRGDERTFKADPQARAIADRALARGFDQQVPKSLRTFFYLPFMHSENLADQERSVSLYRALGDVESLKYADDHADIIQRFGRFPHRNKILGRATTDEEQAFLDSGGFAG